MLYVLAEWSLLRANGDVQHLIGMVSLDPLNRGGGGGIATSPPSRSKAVLSDIGILCFRFDYRYDIRRIGSF